jgi:hypothetical protein
VQAHLKSAYAPISDGFSSSHAQSR